MEASKKRPQHLPASARFEFHDPIGAGGAGTVYRGRDRQTGQPVALKVLRHKLSENPALHRRLAREFRAASRLEHPNIVRAVAFESDGETAFVAYELVDGGNLVDRIEAHGRLPEADAVRVITQVAQALHYAHQHKVVHRDVKPENVLLLADGRAKLTDFGLAKDHALVGEQDLTRHASALGTPHYMAPEQFADARSAGVGCDVYSLAATLYTLVTAELPYSGKTALAILNKKTTGSVPSARAVVPELSERTDRAIRAGLDPDPAKRPASCLAFFQLLTARRRATDPPLPPPSRATDSGPNRRAAARVRVEVGSCGVVDTSALSAGPIEERWPLVIRDVSAGGVGLLLARRFEPGTVLGIELAGGPDDRPRRVDVRVVRVRKDRAGHWAHGCALVTPAADADLRGLLDPA
ncbi:MAG: serine/threonine-protein kinase [Gemmataceae bacterium]